MTSLVYLGCPTAERLEAEKILGSADLTVTLVNDYLDAQLAELNRRHLDDRSSWLLVQPSGIFPLVGPVLRPQLGHCGRRAT